jgi:hypothetical protein
MWCDTRFSRPLCDPRQVAHAQLLPVGGREREREAEARGVAERAVASRESLSAVAVGARVAQPQPLVLVDMKQLSVVHNNILTYIDM